MTNITELSEARRTLLARFLQGDQPQATAPTHTIPQRAPGGIIPLSFGQQQMWLLTQLIPDIPVYNECVTIHLPGPLNVSALEQSFNEIIRRHEAWRTSFPTIDGQPVQMIHPPTLIPLPVVDLRHLPEAEREAQALQVAKQDTLCLFDLAHGPLLRPRLIRLGEEKHWLSLALHHIIFDGISIYQVFLSELSTLYEAFSAGHTSPLPELPIQYADFAVWQREQMQRQITNQLAYWKNQLDSAPITDLELFTDRSRPQIPTYQGAIHLFRLSKYLTDALRDLGYREGVTLFMTLLAALDTLLYRYTGQKDIVIGTAAAGRKQTDVQGLMGVFINPLVMRTNIASDISFCDLLKQVRETTLEAHAHQDVPFEYLVKELRPERNLGANPLFQVLLMLEPSPQVLPSGWTMTHLAIQTHTSKLDLSLNIEDRSDGLVGRFEYNTDLFNASTIARMAGHWQTLLAGIVADPSQRLAELPILTETERRQVLVEWNATTTTGLTDQCVHQVFEAQVERTPTAVAVVFEEQRLTYQELNTKANQLAHYLQHLGVGPEVLVGIYLERSIEMIIALLGILKAGGAYVPLDPAYPKERLAFMLSDTQMPVLLTQQSLAAEIPIQEQETQIISLDADWGTITKQSMGNPMSQVQSGHLAYVLYTSGSTGRPKGVTIEHRQLWNYTHAILARVDLEPGFSFAMVQPLTVDSCITTIFPTLCTGGSLHVVSQERAIDAHALEDYFQHQQIDCLKIAPSHLAALHASSHATPIMPRRLLIIGGEASSWEWVKSLQTLAPTCTIFNHYGPTETTVGVLTHLVSKDEHGRSYTTTPSGRPLANTQVYILDQHLQPVPIGVPGELYIGGANVARGYLNRPELTAEKFIPDPFSPHPAARLYKTGDLVRYLPDGTIEFLGRNDDQVKIRGFRIELGEIQAVLSQHPTVQSALVLAREDTPGDKRLVAYVVLHEDQQASIEDLQHYAMQHLPTHMLPSTLVLLEALPLTPHGKVDRHALPRPDTTRIVAKDTLVAPKLLLHQQLIQIWEELLEVRPIGIRDNFFDLGGHSLLAARLFNQIEQVCGKKLPLATFFARPTIEHLVQTLQQETMSSSRTPLVPVQATGTKRPFFFLHGDWTGGAFYCSNLARHLGPDQPFYVLEPYRFDGLQVPPTFEEMATAHIQTLQAVQPEGPYLLGGYCNGALVAHEVARQLHAQGQGVDLLVLMDPATPTPYNLLQRIISRIGNLIHMDESQQLDWFLRFRHLRLSWYYWRLKHAKNLAAIEQGDELARRNDDSNLALSQLDSFIPTLQTLRQDWPGIYNWVSSRHIPGLYPGKAIVFWNKEELFRRTKWRNRRNVAKEIEIQIIPGDHMTCRTEYLPVLAENLQMCLKEQQ